MNYTLALEKLIQKNEFKRAEEMAEKLDLVDEFITLLMHPRHSKQTNILLRRYKGEDDNIPAHFLKIMKTRFLNYVDGSSVDGQAEIRLIGDKRLLACFAERLFLKHKIDESLSLIKRHDLKTFINDSRVKKGLDRSYIYIENEYIKNDGFCKVIRPRGESNL